MPGTIHSFLYVSKKLKWWSLSFTFLGFLISCAGPPDNTKPIAAKKPNIVLIMADDMGYSDLGLLGGDIHTPFLDSLAQQGVLFLNLYNNAKCYPSRASLLTGMYPHRTGLARNILHVHEKKGDEGPFQGWLSHKTPTVAERLKALGYRTYLSGKWHVGEKREDWPLQRGFDRYFGLVSGASSYFELLPQTNGKRVRQMAMDNALFYPPDSGFYMTRAISNFAVRCIREHDTAQPFFLYVAYTAPHWPLHALQEDIAKYENAFVAGWDSTRVNRIKHLKKKGYFPEKATAAKKPGSVPDFKEIENKEEWSRRMAVYAAMVDRMDQGIGSIWRAVQQLPEPGNTIFIFLSDNGPSAENIEHRRLHQVDVPVGLKGSYKAYQEPWAYVSNAPFQNYKLSLYEGGIKTPCIFYWPAKVRPNIVHYRGHLMDIVPTLLAATETRTDSLSMDGINLLPVIKGKEKEYVARPLFWEYNGHRAMLEKNYKLVREKEDSLWQLYDLRQDPAETANQAKTRPEKVLEMRTKYEAWEKEMLSLKDDG